MENEPANDAVGQDAARHKHEHEVTLDIATPKGRFEGAFPRTTTVKTVIEVVVEEKHLDRKDNFELVHREKVLQPDDRDLASFHLHGTEKLELVAQGSGV